MVLVEIELNNYKG